MSEPEKKLLLKVAGGSESAFRQLFDQYHHQLGRYIFRITQSQELTEEIVQDIFLKVWLNRAALAQIQSFKAYLFVASKNQALNHLRNIAREQMLKNQWKEETANAISTEHVSQDLYYQLLDEAINKLPPQQQKVYLLSRHQRLKYDEIAAELNLSRETVKSYLKLATTSITSYVTSHVDVVSYLLIFLLIF